VRLAFGDPGLHEPFDGGLRYSAHAVSHRSFTKTDPSRSRLIRLYPDKTLIINEKRSDLILIDPF
jgi:hypothetical protein